MTCGSDYGTRGVGKGRREEEEYQLTMREVKMLWSDIEANRKAKTKVPLTSGINTMTG